MKMNLKLCALALALAGIMALIGCNNNQTPPAPNGPGNAPGGTGAGKKLTIGMSQCNKGEPWRAQMDKDIAEAAAKHPEITMIFRDASKNAETQQNQMREFVQQKVNLII